MSDPVKSSEIEDVLASIRRLVSEEARSEIQTRRQSATQSEDAPETAKPPEAEAPAADALVLTPALRVHEGGRAASAPLAPRDEQAATDHPESGQSEPASSESDHPETNWAEASEPDVEWADTADHAEEDAKQPSESPEVAAEDDLPEPPSEPQSLEAKIAALEALIAGSAAARQPAEDELAEDSAEVGPESDEAPREEAIEAWQPEVEVEDTPDFSGAEGVLEWQDHQPAADDAEPEYVATEGSAPVEEPAQAPEMAELHDVETAIHELASQDSETAAASEAEQATPGDTPHEPPHGPMSIEALPIDEAVLREMVIDIVREELQGALGERITRNVRRLVRREIHRALASQELD